MQHAHAARSRRVTRDAGGMKGRFGQFDVLEEIEDWMTSRLGVDLELLLGPVPRPVACATDHPRARPGKASCGLRQGEGAGLQACRAACRVQNRPTSGLCHSDLRQWIGRGAWVPQARSDGASGCDGPMPVSNVRFVQSGNRTKAKRFKC